MDPEFVKKAFQKEVLNFLDERSVGRINYDQPLDFIRGEVQVFFEYIFQGDRFSVVCQNLGFNLNSSTQRITFTANCYLRCKWVNYITIQCDAKYTSKGELLFHHFNFIYHQDMALVVPNFVFKESIYAVDFEELYLQIVSCLYRYYMEFCLLFVNVSKKNKEQWRNLMFTFEHDWQVCTLEYMFIQVVNGWEAEERILKEKKEKDLKIQDDDINAIDD